MKKKIKNYRKFKKNLLMIKDCKNKKKKYRSKN